jgi:hypothetical protein
MKRTLALATILVGTWAAVAAADGGGPSPGLDYGNGVVAPGGKLRYLALTNQRTTLFESVVIGTGKVQAAGYFKGAFGIPLVTYAGDTGGLSRDGRRLVLATWPGVSTTTRLMIVDPRRFRVLERLKLKGAFAFDALSPDGSLIYLLQYLGKPGAAAQPYAVRAYNSQTKTLYPGAIVDRREPDEKMTGLPMTRTGTASGWAYTLYSRPDKRPFVHALDTVHRRAFCVDLPWKDSDTWVGTVRLRVRGGVLELRRGGRTITRVDRKTLEVRR